MILDRQRPLRRVVRRWLLGTFIILAPAWLASQGSSTSPPPNPSEEELREASQLRGAAVAKMAEGNWIAAESDLVRLAKLLPDNLLPPINLAICYLQTDRMEEARQQIDRARAMSPDNPQMLFTLAAILEAHPDSEAAWREVVEHFASKHASDPRPAFLMARHDQNPADSVANLQRALDLAPENLLLMVDLLVAAAKVPDPEVVTDALYAIEDRLDGFEGPMAEQAQVLRRQIDNGAVDELLLPATFLRNLSRPTDIYQAGIRELLGGLAELFPQLDFDPRLPASVGGGQDIEVAWVEVSPVLGQITSLIPAGEPEVDRVLAVSSGHLGLLEAVEGTIRLRGIDLALRGPAVAFDADTDGLSDILVAEVDSGIWLYPQRSEASNLSYGEGLRIAPAELALGVLSLHPLDVDHDGDLDLFVARQAAKDLYLQNNGDGSWTELGERLGCAGDAIDTTDIAIADLDNDGDLDLLVVRPARAPQLLLNDRTKTLTDGSSRYGLDLVPSEFRRVRISDLDHDGLLDLLFFGESGGRILLNRGASFETFPLPAPLETAWLAGELLDIDNDGDLDLIAALAPDGQVVLARNRRGRFEILATELEAQDIQTLASTDLDADGDLDLLAQSADHSLRWWRNDGGNRNNWLRVGLQGKNTNNSKNNTQGFFSRIEARSGNHIQVGIGNGGINHIGLGSARELDVLRVVWTNGLAQTWPVVSANQIFVEEQVLKGSCPFVFAWNGQEFEFVTDLMWRSPLGMILSDGRSAPHQSARDFVKIPGASLLPVDGKVWLQATAELWETVYIDRQVLWAADHPEDTELVVDERFQPPPYPREAPVHLIRDARIPVTARDHLGNDQLDRVLHRDGIHVDDLPLTRYQGLTRGHSLELEFSDIPAGKGLRLLLWGWIFPTDTSINVALSQDSSRHLRGPRLEVLGPHGTWQEVSPFIGFPNGKRKAMVVDLPDSGPGGRVKLRISTTLQIYWDAVALAVAEPETAPRLTPLSPLSADLHFRGYSQLYRETATGPHLFDYSRVSVQPRFRGMLGTFTRYGTVRDLLTSEDSQAVVMAPGDEVSISFEVSKLPPLAPGWRRDWILYTDGWVKDADINTVRSQTVEPMPYHGMVAYPDDPEHAPPDSAAYRAYLNLYQTREGTDRSFRDAIHTAWTRQP